MDMAGKKADSSFTYRGKGRTTESVMRRSKQSSGSYDSYVNTEASMFKAKEGECTIRILPPTWEDIEKYGDGWELGIWVHYGVGADEGAYLCVDKMNAEPCAICEARRSSRNPEEQDNFKPTWRALCWIIDRDNEKAGPQVWSMPATLFREINTRSVDKKNNEVILVDHHKDGYDLTFVREGSQLKTKYTGVEISRDPTPLHDNPSKMDRWLEYVEAHPLPELLQFYDSEHIEKVLFGKTDRPAKDEDEDERPSSSKRSRRPAAAEEEEDARPMRSRRRAADDEDDEDVPKPKRRASSEDEDEDEERPSARAKSNGADEDEDEDAPKPKKRGKEEEEEEEDEKTSPSQAARGQLKRLRR